MPELFFHVGLGKTASTYLQARFFPKLKGIHYVPTNIYRFYPSIIKKGEFDRYLFSREFDRQFFTETEKIAATSRSAKIIIILRNHDSWIASQYRRYVKNGGKQTFEQFIDLETDNGAWKQKDLYFYPMLKYIQENFEPRPLVLFHKDLKDDAQGFLNKIANYLGASFDLDAIDLRPKHSSYSDHQLKFAMKFSPFNKDKETHYQNRMLTYITYRSRWLINHLILYSALLIPKNEVNPLISDQHLEKINAFYKDDWAKCIEFAKIHSA